MSPTARSLALPRERSARPEGLVQRQIEQVAPLLGLYLIRVGKNRSRQYRGVTSAGAPDLIGCNRRGQFVAIECKAPKDGRLSPDQVLMHERISAHNGVVIVARSVEDVRKALGMGT